MSRENEQFEVYFDVYCKKCKHENTDELEEPCFECMSYPVNTCSYKPVMFEEKGK